MKKYINYILAAAASVVMFAACDLNLVPNNAIAYEEGGQLIQTQANLDAFENGILASFRGSQGGMYHFVEEFELDCWNAVADYGNNYGSIHRTDYTFTSTDYDTEDLWEACYGAMKNYNILIAAADNVPEKLADKVQVVKGEALFFRAATYLRLAQHFGKTYGPNASTDLCVPLVLVYDQQEKPERATVAAVYDQILADLKEASNLLANVKGSALAQKPTIDAVKALYARVYLDLKDYKNAADCATAVINSNNYALASTAEEMEEVYQHDGGKESIYQGYCTMAEGAVGYGSLNNVTSDATYGEAFRPYYIPTQTVIDAYDEGDLRFGCWFNNTVAVQINGAYHVGEFYTFTKFRGNPALTTSPIRSASQAAKPFKIGEMYLIAAEAYCQSGNTASAMKYLNELQIARGAEATEPTLDNIKKEWMKETIGEGMRLNCLKRWGQGFHGRPIQNGAELCVMTGTSYEQKEFAADSPYFQWPIPSYEMKVNKNLVQNAGYDGN